MNLAATSSGMEQREGKRVVKPSVNTKHSGEGAVTEMKTATRRGQEAKGWKG